MSSSETTIIEMGEKIDLHWLQKQIENAADFDGIVLQSCEVDEGFIKNVQFISKLTYMGIVDSHVAASLADHVGAWSNLCGLDFSGMKEQVGDLEAAKIAKLRSLEYLNVDSCRISKHGLHALLTLPKLTRLKISRNLLSDDCVEQIAATTILGEIELWGNEISTAALSYLRKQAPHLRVTFLGTEHNVD